VSGVHSAADIRSFDKLTRGPIRWTGTGTSVRPLLDAQGQPVVWRAYNGVHESYWPREHDAVLASRDRNEVAS